MAIAGAYDAVATVKPIAGAVVLILLADDYGAVVAVAAAVVADEVTQNAIRAPRGYGAVVCDDNLGAAVVAEGAFVANGVLSVVDVVAFVDDDLGGRAALLV